MMKRERNAPLDFKVEDLRGLKNAQADFKIVYPEGPVLLVNLDTTMNMVTVCGIESNETPIEVVIPKSILGYPITKIGEKAFFKCHKLVSITIPNTITCIEEGAFFECNELVFLKIPSSIKTIGRGAFSSCERLESINIPNSLTSIESSTFQFCYCLKKIKIPASIKEIGIYAFSGCTNLSSIIVSEKNKIYDSRDNCNAIIETKTNTLIVGCKDTIIPDSVTTIGYTAFDFCSTLREISIPNSVQVIEMDAFSKCDNLRKIFIPKSVSKIEDDSFNFCDNLSSIQVHPENKTYDSRDNCNAVIRTQDNMLMIGCNNTTIPNSITKIGPHAFSLCEGIKEINIPNSVCEIGSYAFGQCRNLMRISIPKSTQRIEGEVFRACKRLSSIRVDKKNRYYDSRLNCNAIIETKSNTLIQGCWQTKIPNSIETIGIGAFADCACLISIVVPDAVISIEKDAFSNCSNLTEVILPKSLIRIGEFAFAGCSSLTSIEIPSSVEEIGEDAFSWCNNLKKIITNNPSLFDTSELPDGVEITPKCVIENDGAGRTENDKKQEDEQAFANYLCKKLKLHLPKVSDI